VNHARRLGSSTVAAMLLCAMFTSVAGGAPPVLDMVPTLDTIRSRLELTPAQEAQLRPIFETRKSELTHTQLQLQTAATRAQRNEVLRNAKKAGDAFNAQVESVLTPVQRDEWQQIRSEIREKAKERIEEKQSSG